MINFTKGIAVGIFNIVPGLSGSALLVILNLYEKCLEMIASFFKNPKKSSIFLFPIASGVMIGTYLFSNVIFLLLKNFPMETYIVFTFFILGTIPHLFKEATKNGFKKTYIIPFAIAFFIGIILLHLDMKNLSYSISYDITYVFKYFLIGIVLSFSTVIPGISSTVLLSLLNLYGIYIESIAKLDLFVLIPILLGFIITTFLISKVINYLLKKHYGHTFFAILGFSLSTIPILLKIDFVFNLNLIISIFTGLICFVITYLYFKVIK